MCLIKTFALMKNVIGTRRDSSILMMRVFAMFAAARQFMGYKFWQANHKNAGETYLQKYPELTKWINECTVCHNKGYRLDMPAKEHSAATGNIRIYFKPLAVNSLSICKNCERLAAKCSK